MKNEKNSHEISTANFQFQTEKTGIPLIFTALKENQQVILYNGDFPEPFERLTYVLRNNQNQLVLASSFQVGADFTDRFGRGVGSPEVLGNLLKRYTRHEFSPDNSQLFLFNKEGQIESVIARNEDQIIIQRGGGAGQLALVEENDDHPINRFSTVFTNFSTLAQRYVNTIWNSSPETNKKNFQLVLAPEVITKEVIRALHSTFDVIEERFRTHYRPMNLDEDVGGYPGVKIAIKNLFLAQTEPERSQRYGVRPHSDQFLLLTGSEGTGKSLFPKALYTMLDNHYKGRFDCFSLSLSDMLRRDGLSASTEMGVILDKVRENEKKHIVTLVLLDRLEHSVPEYQRSNEVNLNLANAGHQIYNRSQRSPSVIEFNYAVQVLDPIVEAVRQFGKDIGANSHHTIIVGESRLPRESLPDGISKTFRHTFSLDNPTAADTADILRVQINITKEIAKSTDRNPFTEDVDSSLKEIALHAVGLNGRLIQQIMTTITSSKNVEGKDSLITPKNISDELDRVRMVRGLTTNGPENRRIGFDLPHFHR